MAQRTSNIVVGAMSAQGKLSPAVERLSDKTLLKPSKFDAYITCTEAGEKCKMHLPNGH